MQKSTLDLHVGGVFRFRATLKHAALFEMNPLAWMVWLSLTLLLLPSVQPADGSPDSGTRPGRFSKRAVTDNRRHANCGSVSSMSFGNRTRMILNIGVKRMSCWRCAILYMAIQFPFV